MNVVLFSIPTVILKDRGYSNTFIGLSTLVTIPYAIKFLWGPIVDSWATKRAWILRMAEVQTLLWCVLLVIVIAPTLSVPAFLTLLFILSIFKGPQEIALVGYYLVALSRADQAKFIGIRPLTSRLAMVTTGSVLVAGAGIFGKVVGAGDPRYTWGFYFACLILIYTIAYFWVRMTCPFPPADAPIKVPQGQSRWNSLAEPFRALLRIKGILLAVLFILFVRAGEAFIQRMVVPFYMDSRAVGGYASDVTQVGLIGAVGLLGATLGALLSGFFIKKYGIRKIMGWFIAATIFPNLIYTILAIFKVDTDIAVNLIPVGIDYSTNINLALVCAAFGENLGYGLGFSATEYFLFSVSRGTHQTTIAGVLLSVLYFCTLIFGSMSGWVQSQSGWAWFFVISVIISMPVFLIIPRLQYPDEQPNQQPTK